MKYTKLFTLSILLILLSACGKNDYPAETITNFVNACVENGGQEAMCSCAIDKIQHNMNHDEFLKMETRLSIGDSEASKVFADLIAECRK